VFAEMQKGQASSEGKVAMDLWLPELHYRAAVASFDAHLHTAAKARRELLERFRSAEHKRATVLHGSIRVFVSLQQRLWADISASTSAVHSIFKELPGSAGLSEQADGVSLEAFLHDGAMSEYRTRADLPGSQLVLRQGPLQYKRALLRTWAQCHCVLTADLYMQCFSSGPEALHGNQLQPKQLLFSVRCAPGTVPELVDEATFEVASVESSLFGKVFEKAAGQPTSAFRAHSAHDAAEWIACFAGDHLWRPEPVRRTAAPPPAASNVATVASSVASSVAGADEAGVGVARHAEHHSPHIEEVDDADDDDEDDDSDVSADDDVADM
jgi:hypothetical protein